MLCKSIIRGNFDTILVRFVPRDDAKRYIYI